MDMLFGLIGKTLGHSFSQRFFNRKFEREGLTNCTYELFELEEISQIDALIEAHPNLRGLNVTIPYKEVVHPYVHSLDSSAEKVGAINVIKITPDGQRIGYNSDYYGFRVSIEKWLLSAMHSVKALVLGTGGASKAVAAALKDMEIDYKLVSRQPGEDMLSYTDLLANPVIVQDHHLIINTTPLGMEPNTKSYPDIPYHILTPDHFLYDLVYNPTTTFFMAKGGTKLCHTKNGLEMLHLQAEKSWEIWTDL